MDVWDAAVRFLLVGDRATQLAMRHPLIDGVCGQCEMPGCTPAHMAAEALAILQRDGVAGAGGAGASILVFPAPRPAPH